MTLDYGVPEPPSFPQDQEVASPATSGPPQARPRDEITLVTSEQVDKILPALVSMQGMMPPLLRDKTANVIPKDQSRRPYSFRYASLASVKDTITDTLFLARCVFVHAPVGGYSVSRLWHESGQYIEARMLLRTANEGGQAFNSAMTYNKRVAMTAILNLAADEDDDGNAADGNSYDLADTGRGQPISAGVHAAQPGLTQEEQMAQTAAMLDRKRMGIAYHQVIELADKCRTPLEAVALLDVWRTNWPILARIETHPQFAQNWVRMRGRMLEAMNFLGSFAHDLFRDLLMAGTAEKMRNLMARLDDPSSDYALGSVALQRQHPQAWSRMSAFGRTLFRDLEEVEAESSVRRAAAAAAEQEQEERREAAHELAQPLHDPALPSAFAFNLHDELGEVGSDIITDPRQFAREYEAYWEILDTEEARSAFYEYNAEAVQVGSRNKAIAEIFETIHNVSRNAEQFVVLQVRNTGRGAAADHKEYLDRFAEAADEVDGGQLDTWFAAQAPVRETLATGPRMLALRIYNTRRGNMSPPKQG